MTRSDFLATFLAGVLVGYLLGGAMRVEPSFIIRWGTP